jgi:hypothetical protein
VAAGFSDGLVGLVEKTHRREGIGARVAER